MDYREIRSLSDASEFAQETNDLHDGYLVSANYVHGGYTWGNPLLVDPHKATLTLQIMVTSIHNTLVEIRFEGVREFQIKENDYEIVDSSVAFSKEGLVQWNGDPNYVIAEKMKWKTVL